MTPLPFESNLEPWYSAELWNSLIVRNGYKGERKGPVKRATIFYVALLLNYIFFFIRVFVVFPSMAVNVIVYLSSCAACRNRYTCRPVAGGLGHTLAKETIASEGNHLRRAKRAAKKREYRNKSWQLCQREFSMPVISQDLGSKSLLWYTVRPKRDCAIGWPTGLLGFGSWQRGRFFTVFLCH